MYREKRDWQPIWNCNLITCIFMPIYYNLIRERRMWANVKISLHSSLILSLFFIFLYFSFLLYQFFKKSQLLHCNWKKIKIILKRNHNYFCTKHNFWLVLLNSTLHLGNIARLLCRACTNSCLDFSIASKTWITGWEQIGVRRANLCLFFFVSFLIAFHMEQLYMHKLVNDFP